MAKGNQELFTVPGQSLTKSSKLQQFQLDWGEEAGLGGGGAGVRALLLNADLNFSPGVRQLRSSSPSRGRRRGHSTSHFQSFFFFPACTGGRTIEGIRYPPSLKPQTHTCLSAYQGHKSHWRPKDGPGLARRPGHSDGEGRGSLSHASTKEC